MRMNRIEFTPRQRVRCVVLCFFFALYRSFPHSSQVNSSLNAKFLLGFHFLSFFLSFYFFFISIANIFDRREIFHYEESIRCPSVVCPNININFVDTKVYFEKTSHRLNNRHFLQKIVSFFIARSINTIKSISIKSIKRTSCVFILNSLI